MGLRRHRWKQGTCAALLALAFAGVGWIAGTADAQTRIARHGLSTAEYQSTFDELSGKGYRLQHVSGYVVDGQTQYAALWRKSSGPLWTARYGLPAVDYQNLFDDFTKQGYRLTYVSGYEVHGAVRYAAIWEKRTGPLYGVRHGMTSAEYQDTYDYHVRQGYRPLHVSAYSLRGEPRFAAIFERSPGPLMSARHNLTSEEYQAAFDDHLRQGFRLKSVSGYSVDGKDRFLALWEKSEGPSWQARHALPPRLHPKVSEELGKDGYEPAFVSAFVSGGRPRLNIIWERSAPAK